MKESLISFFILRRSGKIDGFASYFDKRGIYIYSFVISETVVLNLSRTFGRSHLLFVSILILSAKEQKYIILGIKYNYP